MIFDGIGSSKKFEKDVMVGRTSTECQKKATMTKMIEEIIDCSGVGNNKASLW